MTQLLQSVVYYVLENVAMQKHTLPHWVKAKNRGGVQKILTQEKT